MHVAETNQHFVLWWLRSYPVWWQGSQNGRYGRRLPSSAGSFLGSQASPVSGFRGRILRPSQSRSCTNDHRRREKMTFGLLQIILKYDNLCINWEWSISLAYSTHFVHNIFYRCTWRTYTYTQGSLLTFQFSVNSLCYLIVIKYWPHLIFCVYEMN